MKLKDGGYKRAGRRYSKTKRKRKKKMNRDWDYDHRDDLQGHHAAGAAEARWENEWESDEEDED